MSNTFFNNKESNVCLVKNIIHIPCPSCGSTRSVLCILKGEYLQALLLNPLGYILFILGVSIPVWIGLDYMMGRRSMLQFYCKIEAILSKKKYAIPSVLVIMINWLWNINKSL